MKFSEKYNTIDTTGSGPENFIFNQMNNAIIFHRGTNSFEFYPDKDKAEKNA
jgi:hypothetical protein